MSAKRLPKPVRSYHLIALVLLGAFFVQCGWFIYSVSLTQPEAEYIARGAAIVRGQTAMMMPPAAGDASPLVPLLSVAGIAFHLPQNPLLLDFVWLDQHRWFIRMPFLLAGVCLGISLWYVARRLYGTAAGHIVLALFAFSPGMIASASMAGPQILAAWGSFGLIFTAIATAHTLYAPREAILWNWKRITLLGISIAISAGAQWPLGWLLLPAAAFMLWAVPHRRGAAMAILAAAVAVAAVLLELMYLSPVALAHGLANAGWLRFAAHLPAPLLLGRMLGSFYFDSVPAATLLVALALAGWCSSRRMRFFGNTAPLIVFALLLVMAVVLPGNNASATLVATLPFLLLFIAGIWADLIESRLQAPAIVVMFAVAAAQAAYSIAALARMYSRLPGS